MKSLPAITWICLLSMRVFAEPATAETAPLKFTDVDGNTLSTADGHFTVLVVSTKANTDKAATVGARIPDFCLGNANYRMITALSFQTKHSAPVRAVLRSAIRHRLDSEAQHLQKRYDEHKISRDARHDVFAVADFEGAIVDQLNLKSDAALFHVFVFGKNGELLKQWSEVPSTDELAAALKAGGTGSDPSH